MSDEIEKIKAEISDQYLNDQNPRPWIVAFSGGKDSTSLLQLVWSSVKEIPRNKRSREIHIVCNNTLVENPKILIYVKKQLECLKTAAKEQGMPITVEHTVPSLNDTCWTNLIGRGYVAPNSQFRWCTERLKIKPTTKYIESKVSRYGNVIILLGSRLSESNTRARSIRKHEIKGSRLAKHHLPGAYVYSPLKNLSTQEIWWYLAENVSPWGSDNIELVHIYRNASDNNDCPLITDISTPACGGSRFGCWVCTVVKDDKSMKALIDSGDDWMNPLLDLRNFLAATINRSDPEYNPQKYRMPVRRTFQDGLGPYWPEWRKYILEELLKAQLLIQQHDPSLQLITFQEMVAIQLIWQRDFIYDFGVANIYQRIYREKIQLSDSDQAIQEEKQLLREVCGPKKDDFDIINYLLKAEKSRILFTNKRGLQRDLENILAEYIAPTFTDVYKKNSNK